VIPSASNVVPSLSSHQLLVFLLQAGLLLAMALLLGMLARRLGMPAIAGELCAGVVAGPSVLSHIAPVLNRWLFPSPGDQLHLLDAAAQLGVLLLVGITGMQMDLAMVRRRGRSAAVVGIGALLVPFGAGIGTALLLPDSVAPDSSHRSAFILFVGVALGVSALPVIAKTLTDLHLLNRDIGQLILCAVTIDDIVGWTLLSVVSAMATSGVHASTWVALAAVPLVIAAGLAIRPLLRVCLGRVQRAEGNGSLTAFLVVAVLLAAAATQALRLEAIFGAFVCGLLISSCGNLDLARLAPLRDTVLFALAPLYFATAGLRIDLSTLSQPTVLISGVCVLAIATTGKFVGAYLGATVTRLSRWEAVALGAGTNSRGVVEVVIAMTGLQLGVLNTAMYTIIVLIAIVTSLIAPPVLQFSMARAEHGAEQRLRVNLDTPLSPAAEIDDLRGRPRGLRLRQVLRERGQEPFRLVKVRAVARVLDDRLAVPAARRGVAVQQGARLGQHRLRRPGVWSWPAGDRPGGAPAAKVVQRGVGDDHVVGSPQPQDRRRLLSAKYSAVGTSEIHRAGLRIRFRPMPRMTYPTAGRCGSAKRGETLACTACHHQPRGATSRIAATAAPPRAHSSNGRGRTMISQSAAAPNACAANVSRIRSANRS
jgi:Kef-type K+ transport system membrane component KefB